MRNSSVFRLFRPMVSSSFSSYFRMQDAFHNPLIGTLRQCHVHPMPKGWVDKEPLSIIFRWKKAIKSACESERTPLKPLTSRLSSYQILGPGVILLKNYVSIKDQIDIVNICEKYATGPGGFHKPAELQKYMMCFGRNWDPVTGYEKRCTSDGSDPPPPLPLSHELILLAEAAVQDAQAHLNELPLMRPNICLANFYHRNGLQELHQDLDESSDSLERGLPVVTISIGEGALFEYGDTRDEKKLKEFFFESGDVLIFGGKSRRLYHAVAQIAQYTAPGPLTEATGLINGHLSLTFKQI